METNDLTESQSNGEIVEVELETVIEEVMNEFDHIASITIGHTTTHEQLHHLRITVYTGDVYSLEEYRQLFSSDHKIAIDRGEEAILTSFTVCATCDGPVTWDSQEQTTIHMSENVLGADPVQLEDGLAYLLDKLETPNQWSQESTIQLDRIRNYSK